MAINTTGIQLLDRILDGGLPTGFTAIVNGAPGAGTELFAKQFTSAGATNENVIYVSTTERNEDVISTMNRFRWKSDMRILNVGTQYYENVLARKLEVSRYRYEGLSKDDINELTRPIKSKEQVNFLTKLTYEVSKLEPPFRLVVDSLDFYFELHPPTEVVSALRMIKAHVQHNDSVALFTLQKEAHERRIHSGIEGVVDCIIELETAKEQSEFRRYLIVRKIRNHPEKTGIFSYTIGDRGIVGV